MAEPPRRRRRPPQPARSFPLVPILIAVVVVGFAIGGAFSLLSRRDASGVSSGGAGSQPLARVTLAPVATESPDQSLPPSPPPTLAPAPTPTPRASASPRVEPTPSRTPSPEPSASAPASSAPASPVASAAPTVAPTVSATARAVALLRPSPPPPTARPATPPPPTPKAATPVESADSPFARQAAGVVREYLSALARGDDASAQADLDAPAGSREASLSEKEFAGPDMRIANLQAHGTGDSARVDVDIQTAHGAYFAQFFLQKSPSGGAVIVNHDFIKP